MIVWLSYLLVKTLAKNLEQSQLLERIQAGESFRAEKGKVAESLAVKIYFSRGVTTSLMALLSSHKDLPALLSKAVWLSQAPSCPFLCELLLSLWVSSQVACFYSTELSNTSEVLQGKDSALWVFLSYLDNTFCHWHALLSRPATGLCKRSLLKHPGFLFRFQSLQFLLSSCGSWRQ